MQYETRKVADLIPYVNNARTHSDEQVTQLASSIKEFGFINPVIIDDHNGLIAGHGRLMAAKKLGLEEVPVLVESHLTEAQKKAYILADNKLALNAGWDADLLKVELSELKDLGFDNLDTIGFSEDEIKDILNTELEAVEDEGAGEIPEEPKTQRGDIWTLGEHRLMCGDSTSENDVKVLMQDEKADLVFTDPPYGVSYADKNRYWNSITLGKRIQVPIKNDHMSVDDTAEFIYKAFVNIHDYLAEYSSYYITAPQGGELLMMMMMMQKACIPLRHMLIWVKNHHVLGRCDYNYKHEPILYGWIDKHKFYGEGKHKFSTWEIPKPVKNDLHPTMKPIELVENALLNSSVKNNIVLDLFGGSGSTLIACEQLKRRCRMMELDEHYCDIICQRYINFKKSDADVFLLRNGKKISYKEVFS